MKHQRGRGIETIFLIDISSSMAGNTFQRTKDAITAILEEIEHAPFTFPLESVAIVIFGGQTKIIHHLTCNLNDIRKCLDNLSCEGPSPLLAGLTMCNGILQGDGGRRLVFHLSRVAIGPRIVLFTDGQVTDSSYINGPEGTIYYDQDQVKAKLLDHVEKLNARILCVPVGNADMDILTTIASFTNGRVVHIQNVRVEIGRFYSNANVAADLMLYYGVDWPNASTSTINTYERFKYGVATRTERDCSEIRRMLTDGSELEPTETMIDAIMNKEHPEMPPLGSRVRRGPDWEWGNQDHGGLGTVTGHNDNGWLNVQWDNGSIFPYRFGGDNGIDLEIVYEPRILKEEENVAIGCMVTRGPDWEWGNQDGGAGKVGTIYSMPRKGEVYVRWPNGHRSNYRFGYDGKYDVEICDINKCANESKTSSYWKLEPKAGENKSSSHCSNSKEKQKETKENKWQYRDSKMKWTFYPPKANAAIERAYQRNPMSSAIVDLDGVSFRVVMKRKIHINMVTKEESGVRYI